MKLGYGYSSVFYENPERVLMGHMNQTTVCYTITQFTFNYSMLGKYAMFAMNIAIVLC